MLRDSNPHNCYVLIAFEATYRSYGSIHWRKLEDSNLCPLTGHTASNRAHYHSAKFPLC